MDLSRYAELFLTESQEHLQAINESLLELERGGFDAAAVDRFFRAVHTIKGMSATMGYTAVAQLTHEMESLLSDVRDGSRSLDGDLLDPLFIATDALEAAVNECAAGRADGIDLGEALSGITAARTGSGGPAGGRSAPPPEAQPESAAAVPDGALRIEVQLRKDTPLPGVRALLIVGRLRAAGEVVSLSPGESEMTTDAFSGVFVALIRSQESEEELRKLVLSMGDVENVSVGDDAPLSIPAPVLHSNTPGVGGAATTSGGGHGPRAQKAAPATASDRRTTKHVRIEQRRLDALMNLVGELIIARARLVRRSEELQDTELEDALVGASRQIAELQNEIMASRMVPVWQVFDRFPRLVRDAAHSLGKKVDFVMEGRDIELDRSLLDEIGDPVVHLLRNAVDHGIESPSERLAAGKSDAGRLVLNATRDRGAVLVSVSDDGRGIDREKITRKAIDMNLVSGDAVSLTDEQLFSVISTSGFSTATSVSDISGRGVGVDAAVTRVRSLGGTIEMRTAKGEGTSVTIRLPLTLAIIKALLASAGDETYALPLGQVAETVEVDTSAFRTVRGRLVTLLRDEVLPIVRLREVVQLAPQPDEGKQLVVLEAASKRVGLVVDGLLGQREIVVKQFDAVRDGSPLFSGATILGNGEVALIVDVSTIL